MDLRAITAGRNPPKDINVIIEIPLGGAPVKYELDKTSGALSVDRFLHTAMFYPGNYKDLEKGKWVTIVRWLDVGGAEKLVREAIARAAFGAVKPSAAPAKARRTGHRSKGRRSR